MLSWRRSNSFPHGLAHFVCVVEGTAMVCAAAPAVGMGLTHFVCVVEGTAMVCAAAPAVGMGVSALSGNNNSSCHSVVQKLVW